MGITQHRFESNKEEEEEAHLFIEVGQEDSLRAPGSETLGFGCRVQGAKCRVQGAGCRVQGAGFRVQGVGCRGLELRV